MSLCFMEIRNGLENVFSSMLSYQVGGNEAERRGSV